MHTTRTKSLFWIVMMADSNLFSRNFKGTLTIIHGKNEQIECIILQFSSRAAYHPLNAGIELYLGAFCRK